MCDTVDHLPGGKMPTAGHGEGENATLWPSLEEPVALVREERAGDDAVLGPGGRAAVLPRAVDASAADFEAERMLHGPVERPSGGLRLALFRVSGGLSRI